MRFQTFFKSLFCCFALAFAVSATAGKPQTKWLVIDPITYQTGIDTTAFEGIDNLLLTKLTQANRYKCLDRDAYDVAAREEGFGANVELAPAGYALRGEINQLLTSGKTRTIQGREMSEYIAMISIRAIELRTQEAYKAENLRVTQYCETPKDMLSYVVQRIAFAILTREFPLKVLRVTGRQITLNYGSDFIKVGEQYDVRKVEKIVDEEDGRVYEEEMRTGFCQVISVGKSTSRAVLVSGEAGKGSRLSYYGMGDVDVVLETPSSTDSDSADRILEHGETEITRTRAAVEKARRELEQLKIDATQLDEAISVVSGEYDKYVQKAQKDGRKKNYGKELYVLMLLKNESIRKLYKQYFDEPLEVKMEAYRTEVMDAIQSHKDAAMLPEAETLQKHKRALRKAQQEERRLSREVDKLIEEYSRRAVTRLGRRELPRIQSAFNSKKASYVAAQKEVERCKELVASAEAELASREASEKDDAARRDIQHKDNIASIVERYERETIEALKSRIASRKNLVAAQIVDDNRKLEHLRSPGK